MYLSISEEHDLNRPHDFKYYSETMLLVCTKSWRVNKLLLLLLYCCTTNINLLSSFVIFWLKANYVVSLTFIQVSNCTKPGFTDRCTHVQCWGTSTCSYYSTAIQPWLSHNCPQEIMLPGLCFLTPNWPSSGTRLQVKKLNYTEIVCSCQDFVLYQITINSISTNIGKG